MLELLSVYSGWIRGGAKEFDMVVWGVGEGVTGERGVQVEVVENKEGSISGGSLVKYRLFASGCMSGWCYGRLWSAFVRAEILAGKE